MRKVMVTAAALVLACGGGGGESEAAEDFDVPMPMVAPVAPPSVAPTGVVHQVQMLETPSGQMVFVPAELTIRQGDLVRWVNVSGGPHNVAFFPDKIPTGGAAALNAAMANRMSSLSGQLLFEDNAVYEIAFTATPPGTYQYYCTPHRMLQMTGTLVVTQ